MNAMTRRQFVRNTTLAAGAAALSGPFIRSLRAGEPGPNDKIRLGVIGCGGMGQGDLDCFLENQEVECVVICDVDEKNSTKGQAICAKKERKKPDTVKDFRRVLDRKDVDAVLIATPDHWHAIPTVMACQAGKDVYVEKPLSKTIDEGRAMLTAAQKHNRVVQMGSQWRSCQHMIDAAEFVKSGKLGKLAMARGWAYLDWIPQIGKPADCPPPAGVDYNMWLGPAPQHAFNPNRYHFNFRWFWDYAGGLMTDWGVHLLNMVLMGTPAEAPKSVVSLGGKYVLDDNSETPDSQVTTYEFPNFMLVWEHKAGLGVGINNRPWGVAWYGTEGTIMMDDSGWEVIPEHRKANLEPEKHKGSGNPRPAHVRNFLDCMKSRQQPVLNLERGHYVSTVAHLGNIAYRSGSKITWDAEHEKVVGNPVADKLVGVKYRKPWKLDYMKRS
ncbi:MAG: Gfo/Idh/MocA family oxidoreductase [Verrucomicrobia bacterium]|nr:Gfo/Idh/MocA family oxidoreductase [Verrucomicrobiota bacterium]